MQGEDCVLLQEAGVVLSMACGGFTKKEGGRMISNEQIIMRLLVSVLLGSLIGIERERLNWAAGLRTHMIVCMGSCLIMVVSAFGFQDVLHVSHVSLDPSRVAAQVVSGIGFLGAGTILVRQNTILGLTTAASLWAVAAIGLAVGGGLYIAASAATAIVLVVLAGLKRLEKFFFKEEKQHEVTVRSKGKDTVLRVLTDDFEKNNITWSSLESRTEDDGSEVIHLAFNSSQKEKELVGFVERIKRIDGVSEVLLNTHSPRRPKKA